MQDERSMNATVDEGDQGSRRDRWAWSARGREESGGPVGDGMGTREEGLAPCPLSPRFRADACTETKGKGSGCCPLGGNGARRERWMGEGKVRTDTCKVSWLEALEAEVARVK